MQNARAHSLDFQDRWHARLGDPPIVGVARPADYSDPNLTKWEKSPNNPIAVHGAHSAYAGPSEI